MRIVIQSLVLLLLTPLLCIADSTRPNTPIVAAGNDGTCYAKSVPSEFMGQKGTTKIYIVGTLKDSVTDSYNWYSDEIYISCKAWINGRSETTVVRMGPWADGLVANQSDLAIAFYLNGKLLKKYSTLDIAGKPTNVHNSVSHYKVFSSILGFKWKYDEPSYFVAIRIDGVEMKFDTSTGLLAPQKKL